MTFEEFKLLAQKIERSARDPKQVAEVIDSISKLSTEEINERYKRAKKEDATFLPYERLLEVAIKAYFDAVGIATKNGEKLPENDVFEIIKALVNKGAALELLDSEGQPVLHQAIYLQKDRQWVRRYHEALHQLFSLAATKETVDFNIRNQLGDNLLIRAVRTRNYELVEYLHAQFDCDLNLLNKGTSAKLGETVLDVLNNQEHQPMVQAMVAYVRKNKGISGKALSASTFNDLSNRMGRENYKRMARDRQPPKSSDQLMKDLASNMDRHIEENPNSFLSFATGLYNADGTCMWSVDKDEIGSKRDIWGVERKSNSDKASDSLSSSSSSSSSSSPVAASTSNDEPRKDPVTFSIGAPNTAASKPKPFSSIQTAVKTACQLKKEPMFQDNVKSVTKEQWSQLLKEAEKWKINKTPSIQAWYSTFIEYCGNLQSQKAEFPDELTKLVGSKASSNSANAASKMDCSS